MAVQLCCVKSSCIDNPFTNLSAEGPDHEVFIGINNGNPNVVPPPGSLWGTLGCTVICISDVSQEDADLCAQRDQVHCTVANDVDHGGGWKDPVTLVNFRVNTNTAQTCSVICPDGLPFDYTFAAGKVASIYQGNANDIANSLACRKAELAKVCLSTPQATACINAPYNSVITATGGTAPYVWTQTAGALPTGMSIAEFQDSASQIVSGVPTVSGDYSFTMQVTDAVGNFMVKTFNISVMEITNTPPAGNIGQVYSFAYTVNGGTAPYTFALESGSLPPGLTLSSFGGITGIPTTSGTSNFTVTITDSSA